MSAIARKTVASVPDRQFQKLPRRFALPEELSVETQPLVHTGRLTLRRPVREDAPAIARALSNPRVAQKLVSVPQPYHLEDAEDWLAAIDAGQEGWYFAITLGGVRSLLAASAGPAANGNDDQTLIGMVAVTWRDRGSDAGWHIGFWLDEAHWGQGIMTEAANAVVARFFSAHMGETLHSGAITGNGASLKIQEKLGFAVTGVADLWSLSRSQMVKVITTELTFGGYMPM